MPLVNSLFSGFTVYNDVICKVVPQTSRVVLPAECPSNCISCSYSSTVGAPLCSNCVSGYTPRLSDGLCYRKYFIDQLINQLVNRSIDQLIDWFIQSVSLSVGQSVIYLWHTVDIHILTRNKHMRTSSHLQNYYWENLAV